MSFYSITHEITNQKNCNPEERIDDDTIDALFTEFSERKRCYHLPVLLKMFMSQVLHGDSCRTVIARGISRGWLPITTCPKTSAYCNARNRLPEKPIRNLMAQIGTSLETKAHESWLFEDRPVKVIDGSSVQLPDTRSNQDRYPQPKPQKEGCGFPVMNVCALMGLESGAMLDVETAAGTGHEHQMFRELWRSLDAGDIVLGDALYGSYAEIDQLQKMGVDGVFRKGTRKFDLKQAERIGKNEWLCQMKRPPRPGNWVSRDELPETITVRVIRIEIKRKGFRSKNFLIYTTLLYKKLYSRETLAELYKRRWEIELRLRDIKTIMGLEMLRCKTPSRCRKELYIGLIVYNLIRSVMLDVVLQYKVRMSKISFIGTMHRICEFARGILDNDVPGLAVKVMMSHIAFDLIPHQPDRVEPRKLKRRQKNYDLLNKPRKIECELLKIGYTT